METRREKSERKKNCVARKHIQHIVAIHVIKLRDLKAFLANPIFFFLFSSSTLRTYTRSRLLWLYLFMHQVQRALQQKYANQQKKMCSQKRGKSQAFMLMEKKMVWK